MPIEHGPQNSAKHWNECTDVYDFLEQVRLRPGVWLPGGSLQRLESILTGYRIALGVHAIDEPFDFGPDGSFTQWLWQHLGYRSSLGWASEVERVTPDGSSPVEEFFRLLDQYRAESISPATDPRPGTGHPSMQAVRIELDRHDWAALRCGCGKSASHLPNAVLRLIASQTPEDASLAGIDGHVMIQSNLMDPAPAVTAVVLAALAHPILTTPVARTAMLQLLLHVSAGDTTQQVECAELIRGAIWILYRELTTHPSIDARAHAYETLSNTETEPERLSAFHHTLRDHLPADLR
ncbi:hypothetical protein IPZ58_36145 [Streptomyces roseoverticillatus]|uniref:hypothetical protein n=1 Tax=Streptomyces roseoverticillatus TaxID=66429 RepID=UPI001F463A17|nr:hypothetical protein [Streptomyces roseoverticillatus]MCF3106954.1 hypothetical protein [Streptomyces roseoverticillatus]